MTGCECLDLVFKDCESAECNDNFKATPAFILHDMLCGMSQQLLLQHIPKIKPL
jgi:hypothetical protein